MGFLDKAKEALSGHKEQVDGAIDKGGDAVDERTGGKFEGQVDQGQDMLKDRLDDEG